MPHVSLILPCYNEAKNVGYIVRRFRESRKFDAELVLVNNGSTDESDIVMRNISRRYKFVKVVTVRKNQGYGHGIMAGLHSAGGKYLAWSHADMQCDPADAFRAFDVLMMQEDTMKTMVKGYRKGRWNILTSGLHAIASLMFFRHFDDINGQPKIFHRSLLPHIKNPPKNFAFDFYVQLMAMKSGWKVISIPVKFSRRRHGKSNWASTLRSRVGTISNFFAYMIRLRFKGVL